MVLHADATSHPTSSRPTDADIDAPEASVRDGRRPFHRSAVCAGLVLGVAMSGFFDGILLHQVQQWHHLLSLVPGEPFRDPRVQIYADGMFHALMYGLLLMGLWFLWQERQALARPKTSQSVWVAFVAGIGAWNVVDVVVFRWGLHLHHIRLDVPNPLAWDIGWLVVLGAAPLGLAVLLNRRLRPGAAHPRAATVLAVLMLGAGTWNLKPPPAGSEVAILFRPGMSVLAQIEAVADVGGAFVASDRSGDLIVISAPARAPLWKLYGRGALVVGGTTGGGCLSSIRVGAATV